MAIWVAIGALLLAAAPDPTAAAKERAEQEQSLVEAQKLVLAHRSAEALPVVRALRTRIEAGLAGEKRLIFSSQTVAMTLLDLTSASAAKRDAVDVGPIYGKTVFLEGFILVDLDRLGEARAALDRAAELSPTNPQFLCEDAHTHARDHDAAGALPIYQRCEASAGLADKSSEARWQAAALRGQGFALTELNRLDEAAAAYKKSLAIEPGNQVALGELQYIAKVRGGAAATPSESVRSDKVRPAN